MLMRGLIARKQVRYLTILRQFHAQRALLKAEAFLMPAMSPTMEQGGVVEWKFKVGEQFSAGDVLLEVETDKAQIDVEAQDDGKLAKILIDNGAKNIKVGEPIAYVAEPDDDINNLELPPVLSPKKVESKKPEVQQKSENKKSSKPEKTKAKKDYGRTSKSSVLVAPDQSQILLPSVQILLHEKQISFSDALDKIPASGPNGRLLKGDVLSYLGQISEGAVVKVAEYVKKGEALDLSNIELKKPEPAQQQPLKAANVKPEPVIVRETFRLKTSPNVSYDQLVRSLKSYISEAKWISHRQPMSNPSSELYDETFEELMASEPRQPRFSVEYQLTPVSGPQNVTAGQDDIFELLAGNAPLVEKKPVQEQEAFNEFVLCLNVFISDRFSDAEKRAQTFVEYVRDLEICSENT
ncbi:LAMI_0A07690g1_1 [Lachancea mirantina]|uniref:LAMI_0A07690g1_1 n=1 Tax=Lachancea mirantina TaxID=1230905 RepID=A0A1G4IR11_9SACH|nr:LAMI_0A07690g1_1 [Lachancea mirantina]